MQYTVTLYIMHTSTHAQNIQINVFVCVAYIVK